MIAPIQARGYIASGEFNGNRTPQHIQNQIIKMYCDANNLEFVLSRAEYWINGSTSCQLWAALREGFENIVFFSVWQLPAEAAERLKAYDHCIDNKIILHFASERMRLDWSKNTYKDLEVMINTHRAINSKIDFKSHLNLLRELI